MYPPSKSKTLQVASLHLYSKLLKPLSTYSKISLKEIYLYLLQNYDVLHKNKDEKKKLVEMEDLDDFYHQIK